jgi:hypothetical protein
MCSIKYLRRVGALSLSLLLLILALSSIAWSYAGNVYIRSDLWGTDVSLFNIYAGIRPNQIGAGSLLLSTSHYRVDPDTTIGGTAYKNIVIFNSPSNPAWLILNKTPDKYNIVQANLGESVPLDTTVTSITWYTKGKPAAPANLSVTPGFEVAKATWRLNPDPPPASQYDYDSVDFELATTSDFGAARIAAITDDVPPRSFITTNIPGKPEQYRTGQLIDGRVLTPGTSYWLQVKGKIAGVPDSDWAPAPPAPFTTTSAAGGGPVTLNLRRKVSTLLGINSFSVPNTTFNITSIVNNITGARSALADPAVRTPLEFIQKVNAAYGVGGPIVRTFGTWNEADQTEKGVVINYSSGTGIATATQDEITRLFSTFDTGRGYQIYVKPFTDADINLTLTLQ